MTERNREPVTPDQNPHPPTDHDRFAPRGETPMPLVDGVALHQPPASTPPPLFRPREERDGAGEGTPVTTPAPGPLLDLDLDLGSDVGPVEAGASATDRGPLLDLDPRPMGECSGAPAPVLDSASAPASASALAPGSARDLAPDPTSAPAPDRAPDPTPTSVPDLDLFVGLDPTPSRTGAGGGQGRYLGPGPDLDARPGRGSSPEPAGQADPGATGQVAPAPDLRVTGEAAQAPARDSDPDPDPRPAGAPDAPLAPVSLEHPGRSLHLEQGEAKVPESVDRPHFRPGSGSTRTEGLGHFPPVRRPRTEPSAEWTPLPAYGEEAGPRPTPAPAAQTDQGRAETGTRAETGAEAQDTDKAPGAKGAPAPTPSLSVPAPQPPPHPRRHSVIAGETTAAIPVHLLFRDDDAPRRTEPTALPTTVARQATHTAPAPTDRTPRPRSPHPRVEPPTRPAPLADPRLAERPGPALSGYAALLTGAAGLLGGLALLWWRGALPAAVQSAVGLAPRPYEGIGAGVWAGLALLVTAVVLALGGLGRGRVGHAWVLTLFGDYRGTVRRTGLVWVSPLLLRRRVDVRLRHWRSEPLPAVDANGTALRVVVLVVWRIKDTVRAALGIEDHEAYLSAQVESAMARVLSQLPADAFHEDAPTLRDAEAVGDALTRMLKADCEPVGVEVYSAQPTGIEYAPEVAAAMQRRRIAAIDAKHRDSVLTSVVDAVDDTVNRLTTRGIVELDDYERKALVKDLTVAFYTGRSAGGDGA
ncbi:Band 7 protein [Streptomyces sp. ZL-24]|uniref:SPFH domain-containing protein n=1 Tax=Streptomyces sp. ZL-24 TaxID=1933029 RepID=UPI000CD3ED74|nr:SPFH domain-containing protein [Streptomyces sp. ZL-24]POG46958.1 Band 7 protein [Streptomyces sp. ZL-24]